MSKARKNYKSLVDGNIFGVADKIKTARKSNKKFNKKNKR